MLEMPTPGNQVFEVQIYNQDVRALVKENQSHVRFEDHWADVQVHDVNARDETEARKRVAERFPPEDGFVIEEIAPTRF